MSVQFTPLKKSFYTQDAVTVAKGLLGTYLCHKTEKGVICGKIVETEAYMGTEDKAAHSYSGKPTDRTRVMFCEGGLSYVYLIYGMHCCFNVVCNKENTPQAVLIRALEPVSGIEIMRENRKTEKLKLLTNGPGKLAQALSIDRACNGLDLATSPLFIAEGKEPSLVEIVSSKRVNIDYAEEAKDFLYRFTIKENPFVSKKP